MEAWSLNYRDLLMLDGRSRAARDGLVPVSDAVGRVVDASADVKHLRVGERVVNAFFRDWVESAFETRFMQSAFGGDTEGLLSQYVALPASVLVRVPESLASVQAAALPCAAVTAWQALVGRAKVNGASTVLIQGIGGVSIFALQFCIALGAKTIVISSSDDKLRRAYELAMYGINYAEYPEWDKEVLAITEERGVSHVVEIGGPETFSKSLKVLAAEGTIAQIDVMTGFGSNTNLMRLQSINANIAGISVGSCADLRATVDFVNTHRIEPVIDKVFGFSNVPEAYEYLRTGAHFGKVVVSRGSSCHRP